MMFRTYFNLIIILPFCLGTTIKEDGVWPWTKTNYLTRANWSSLLIPNSAENESSVWFVFHYLNYCGYCKRAEPGWEAVARYATNWSKYIQIGAYDCANNNDICEDKKYPQWRIYCPETNSTQLGFDSDRRTNKTTDEDILIWLIEKLNGIAEQCYGKSWPVRNQIEVETREELENLISKDVRRFELFISDDILRYTLYVLNHSKTVQTEPIYRLPKQNKIIEGEGVWQGIRNPNGEISLQSMDSREAMKPFVLDKKTSFDLSPYSDSRNDTLVLKPTFSDIDSAVIWMVNRDLRRGLPSLTENVKDWIRVLYTYYPGSDRMKNFLSDLNDYLNTRTNLSSAEFLNYINSSSVIKLSELKFDHCNGSDPSKRGYPCTLWVLFHSLTVKQAILAEQNRLPSNVKPSDLLVSIREFIRHFFLCEECVTHFINMTINVENEINSYEQSVLYLWQGHNLVNQRLRYEEYSNDPNWPKVPFPTQEQCHSCVQKFDATEYNQAEVYKFLKEFYSSENLGRHSQSNGILLLSIVLIHLLKGSNIDFSV